MSRARCNSGRGFQEGSGDVDLTPFPTATEVRQVLKYVDVGAYLVQHHDNWGDERFSWQVLGPPDLADDGLRAHLDEFPQFREAVAFAKKMQRTFFGLPVSSRMAARVPHKFTPAQRLALQQAEESEAGESFPDPRVTRALCDLNYASPVHAGGPNTKPYAGGLRITADGRAAIQLATRKTGRPPK